MHTLWQAFLAAQGAIVENGAVVHFGSPQHELRTAANGTIMADLSQYGLLTVAGSDAGNFLQGQLTNDVRLLTGNNSQYAGYCSAKGRLLALFLVHAHEDCFYLQCNSAIAAAIMKRLTLYVLRAKVKIADVSASVVRIGLAGPDAASVLQRAYSSVPQAAHTLTTVDDARILRLPGELPRFIVYIPTERAAVAWQVLGKSCTAAGAPAWDWLEIRAGIPDITPATMDAFVPQMLNLDALDGISFKKGCYIGQEIVARTHYLGKVKRRTRLAHVISNTAPQPGDNIFGRDSSEPVGMVVRAAKAPAGGYDLLVEVRLASLAAGALRLAAADGPQLSLAALPYTAE